ncbi:MAG: PEGA domain-containing protein, partial [Myxococcota bacterium]|nr:PEGA domain-containing protein [Myxococcota bacterium]
MRTSRRYVAVAVWTALGGLALPAVAEAQVHVTVLELRSIEGDDDVAASLTAALRQAASRVEGWNVSEREVSLVQMALAHDCDESEVSCLQRIAATLQTQRLLYGTLRRASGSAAGGFVASLFLFDASSGQIVGSLTDTIPRARADIDDLRPRARQYVSTLAGATRPTGLRVQSNVAGASVLVDGSSVGVTDARGQLDVDVAPGRHRIEVRRDGYDPFETTVDVISGARLELDATLAPEGSGALDRPGRAPARRGRGPNWIGIALLGAGVAFGGLTVATWAQIESMEDDPAFLAYRRRFSPQEDSCGLIDVAAERGATPVEITRARDVCDSASTQEVLQFVWLGLAVGAFGAGALLLASGGDGEERASAPDAT